MSGRTTYEKPIINENLPEENWRRYHFPRFSSSPSSSSSFSLLPRNSNRVIINAAAANSDSDRDSNCD